jgi:hypothetical protein
VNFQGGEEREDGVDNTREWYGKRESMVESDGFAKRIGTELFY